MGFIFGVLILFLLAKAILPVFLIYAILAILIAISAIYVISSVLSREAEISEILGAVLFILIMILLWGWV